MRIERVVGNTFSEASERSRQLFGTSVMLISSARVGDVHELLVCTDASETGVSDAPGAARGEFAATLQAELAGARTAERPAPRVVPTASPRPGQQAVANAQRDERYQGAALVSAIRSELQALEMRLAGSNGPARGLQQKMALLEQGFTAAYAARVLETGLDGESVSRRLLEDLGSHLFDAELGSRPLLLVGPAASGKTTVAMQATHRIAARRSVPAVVSALRDARPGAREKFFAMADAAQAVSNWGSVADETLVVDGGACFGVDTQHDHAREELTRFDVVLCLPSYLSRAAAARWLDCALPLKGVVITHWSDVEMPLGLLAALAERQLPLLGLSVSADPCMPLVQAEPAVIAATVDRVVSLVLATGIRGRE